MAAAKIARVIVAASVRFAAFIEISSLTSECRRMRLRKEMLT
jgi:hypothetical protein